MSRPWWTRSAAWWSAGPRCSGSPGAYGVALAAHRGDDVAAAAAAIEDARPTAVNLGWGARRALAAYRRARAGSAAGAARAALAEAESIAAEDAAASAAMAKHGLALIPQRARVLTHCNTGALVSAGEGTAFAVIMEAHRAGRLAQLWIDETRPLLQGARLTAYEAGRAGLPHALLADSAAASLLAAGEVDVILTGADRIAADGSVANKVGTYGLAVLAHHHRVPFVVVAPVSTIDMATPDGAAIKVERRPDEEVTRLAGVPVAPAGTPGYNPAFDVTPPGSDHRHRDRTRACPARHSEYAACLEYGSGPSLTVPLPLVTWNDVIHERSRAGRR